MRKFEKISFEQFKKDISDNQKQYEEYELPKRGSKYSAGYDFYAINDFIIRPGEIKKIPTGYKASFMEDEMLLLLVRSSMGFKFNVRMCNQVGVIESDYYNNDSNEGHMFIALQNEGDKDFIVKKGDAYAQAIFTKFLITDDDNTNETRTGGIGSTDRREKNEII